MTNLSTIVIETKDLNWTHIFSLISAIENKNYCEETLSLFDHNPIYFINNSQNIKRITLPSGIKISKSNINKLYQSNQLDFVVIYNKKDSKRNFSELIPFFFLLEKLKKRISFAVNTNEISSKQERERFQFSISTFLYYYRDKKNIRNGEQFYFINNFTVNNLNTGNIQKYSTSKLINHERTISKNFSPFLNINYNSKCLLFNKDVKFFLTNTTEEKDVQYILKSINKSNDVIYKRLKQKKTTQQLAEIYHIILNYNYKNLFTEFFIKSFIIQLNIKEIRDFEKVYGILYLLEKYSDGIEELVENIIFHTKNRTGYLFFIFNKFSDITNNEYKDSLVKQELLNINRILEVYVYDFSEKGILDTYDVTQNDFKLFDLFNIQHTSEDFNHLDLRYSAHLGLKIFQKSIINSFGYYCIETNDYKTKSKLQYKYMFNNEIPSYNKIRSSFNGTHYDILLPISESIIKDIPTNNLITFQSKPFQYATWLQNHVGEINCFKLNNIDNFNIKSKNEQIKIIEKIGNKILNSYSNKEYIALNYNELINFKKPNLLFKLLSYVQLRSEKYIKITLICNAPKNLIYSIKNLIQNLLIDADYKIWNNHTAIILITENLIPYIITGENKDEITQINRKLRVHYPSEHYFDFTNSIKQNIKNKCDNFVQPFELLLKCSTNNIFESYVSKILDNDIENEKIGYRLKGNNVLIGNKIIIQNFYEADTLFQNSFFVDRFAYLISKQIIEKKPQKPLILIGYGTYSEFLINSIKTQLESSNLATVDSIIIAKDIDNDIWLIKDCNTKKLKKFAGKYNYATIVPISSTLSSNNKIITKFKQRFLENKKDYNDLFFYNISVILVRDTSDNINNFGITELEKRFNWKSIKNKVIHTNYKNSKEVNYLVEKNGIWSLQINNTFSFPHNFKRELPIQRSKNLSTNSCHIIGWPIVKEIPEEQFNTEFNRLKLFEKFTYTGHFNKDKSHLHYYFDTESFVTNNIDTISEWLNDVNIRNIVNRDNSNLNIIITPNNNIDSLFVKLINEILFNNTAFIIYMDVYNEISDNIKHKYSFLKRLEKQPLKIHYVDHVLSTGESIRKARNYISSIFNLNTQFTSIITLINRLSYSRNKEIVGYGKNVLFEYINLFIPPIKLPEKECSICSTIKRYKTIIVNSSLDRLKVHLSQKIISLKEKVLTLNNKEINSNNRSFDRLLLNHELHHQISSLYHNGMTKFDIIENLKRIANREPSINYKLNFIKVLSAQPLSNYHNIKRFLYSHMLEELDKIFKSNNNFNILTFNYLLTLLKHLSEFDSNLLIRKNVILNIWKYYFNFYQTINRDEETNLFSLKSQLSEKEEYNIQNFHILLLSYVKNIIIDNEAKSYWLSELLKTGKEITDFINIKVSKTEENNELFDYFLNYKTLFFRNQKTYDELIPKYKNFLVWLFYDNSIIIRNALKWFENEINRNQELHFKFYDKHYKLIPFDSFFTLEHISQIQNIIKDILVDSDPSEFVEKYIIDNPQSIIDNLIKLMYTKIFLNNISIINDTVREFKGVFSNILKMCNSIMESDDSFFTIYNPDQNVSYILSSTNDAFRVIKKGYHTFKTLKRTDFQYPIVSQENLHNYRESKNNKYKHLNTLILFDQYFKKCIGGITFLYKKQQDQFKIKSKENSQFLLIIKNELNELINTALNSQSFFNDWNSQLRDQYKFQKIYTNSDHHYNSNAIEAMAGIDEIIEQNNKYIDKLAYSYIVFSNVTITQLYSNIEKNDGKLKMNVLKSKNTLENIFSESFLNVLKYITSEIHTIKELKIQNIDIINNCNTVYRKDFLRSFVILCIINAAHSHQPDFKKTIELVFEKKKLTVKNDFPSIKVKRLQELKSEFQINKTAIDNLNCDIYSSTTLTSIKGYTLAIEKKFNSGFNEKDEFFVEFEL